MENLKRYLWSSLITFIAGFGLAFAEAVLSFDSWQQLFTTDALIAVLMGAVFAGIRALAKVVIELCTGRLNSN